MAKDMDNGHVWRKKTASVILVWILVASSVFVLFPLAEPKVEAQHYHLNTTMAEDQDFGGGIDYNGGPAGDNIVTWNNSQTHILNNNFFVLDDYVLEIEAGCVVQIDPDYVIQVGQSTGGTIYINGTPGNEVTMQPNSSFPWGGIYVVFGSAGYITHAQIDDAVLIWSDASSLDVSDSEITNMNMYGVYATTNSTVSVTNTFISDCLDAAVQFVNSMGTVDNCDIYGYNATAGNDGGDAVVVTGLSPIVTISNNNNIIGGKGGPDTGTGGGSGGFAVFDVNYDGKLIVVGNQLIKGGDGGNSNMPGMIAGDGGIGVHVMPLSDWVTPPAVNISGNTLIQGGRGGDNNAATDGEAGDGGAAVRITDDPVGSGGLAVVASNTEITGGAGGTNNAGFGTSGWTAGNGGEGIYITNVKKPAMVSIGQNPEIDGGSGGNNTGAGSGASSAGEGGKGILVYNSTEVIIQQSTISGGHGGNNTPTGVNAVAGDGGDGVLLYYPDSSFSSAATINTCTITGGEGGDDWVGFAGPNQGGPGAGGYGISSQQSSAVSSGSIINGGKGGDNFGPMSYGGNGGTGTVIQNSFTWTISGGVITGGKGGSNFDTSGGGGQGGTGVFVSQSNFVSLDTLSNIVGGDGGDSDVGDWGPGAAASNSISMQNSNDVSIMRSTITTGVGGLNSSSGMIGANGSV